MRIWGPSLPFSHGPRDSTSARYPGTLGPRLMRDHLDLAHQRGFRCGPAWQTHPKSSRSGLAHRSPLLGVEFYPRSNGYDTAVWIPESNLHRSSSPASGLPVSPILFMLYTEPIFKLGSVLTHRERFGYADDICQLVTSESLEENTTKLQHIVSNLMG